MSYKINADSFIKAVMKRRTIDSLSELGKELDVDPSTVWRYKERNPDVVKNAEEKLNEIYTVEERTYYTKRLNNREYFMEIDIVQEYIDILKLVRQVGESKLKSYLGSLYHLCNYLKVHPKKLTIEDAVDVVLKAKDAYYSGDPPIKYGLSYSTIRELVRSWFTLMHKVSAEYLNSLGVTKEALKGSGKYAKQRVPENVRKNLEKTIYKYAKDEIEALEAIYVDKFMYYTGTRITATLEFNFNERNYQLNKDLWILEVLDKGEKGGTKWDKTLLGHALDDFKSYCSKRFNISIDDLETELPKRTNYLFPSFLKNKNEANLDKIGEINKKSLIDAGLSYKDFMPNHIWRHTFAQDFLSATAWNYELCGSVGGWLSTITLKRHYGEMGLHPKLNGIRKAMGIEVEEEKRELKW